MTTTKERLDVSTIRGNDVSALALLANALGWRVSSRDGKGVSFSHEIGDHFILPDNDGLRQSVFVAKVKHLCRYATKRPADGWDLADEIADTLKLRRSQRRQFVKAVVDELGDKEKPKEKKPMQETLEPAPPKPVPQERRIVSEAPYQSKDPGDSPAGQVALQREWSDGTVEFVCRHPDCDFTRPTLFAVVAHQKGHVAEVRREAAAAEAARHIVSEAPYQRVKYTKPSEGIVVHEDSAVVIERTWSDGTVDYGCRHCDMTSESPRSIGSHQRVHSKKDPVVETPADEPTPVEADPDEAVVEAVIEPDEVTAEQVLEQIAALVDRGRSSEMTVEIQRLRAENKRLVAEMDDVRQRADRLESNLLVLRELLGEIGRDADGST